MSHPLARDLDHILAHTEKLWDDIRGERLFITGGTGFVGTWLAESFVWAAERLSLKAKAVLLTRNPEAFAAKAPAAASSRCVELLRGDAITPVNCAPEFKLIIHAATEQSFAPTRHEPSGTFQRDVSATRNLLEFASRCAVRRFLFTSSGAVYGKQPPELRNVTEDYAGAPSTVDIASAYGQAKRASEFLCAMYARQFDFAIILPRLFAFIGPHLPLHLNFAAGNFMRDILDGRPIEISGDGTPYRSYLYAADLAIWLWTLLLRGESQRPYNVGSDEEISIRDLAQKMVQNTGQTSIHVAKQPTPGEKPARYVPSIQRVRTELGLRPLISLDEGIRRMYEWHKSREGG